MNTELEQEQKSFNPNSHIIQLKSQQGPKDYLPVQWRLVWFRDQYPQGEITTEILHLDMDKEIEIEVDKWNDTIKRYEKVKKVAKGICVFKATIKDGKGGIATGTKQENAASFADYIEKAETGAIGRALAALGYGTQFTEDDGEGERLADAPVERKPSYDPNKPASESQLTTIAKLVKEMGQVPGDLEGLTYGDAAQMLQDLNKRLQAKRKAS
jgi:hypothetical protein